MSIIDGMVMKYTVVKNEDVVKYLTEKELLEFSTLLSRIMTKRLLVGKRPENTYLVINTDEPYAYKIVDTMKENGHWG